MIGFNQRSHGTAAGYGISAPCFKSTVLFITSSLDGFNHLHTPTTRQEQRTPASRRQGACPCRACVCAEQIPCPAPSRRGSASPAGSRRSKRPFPASPIPTPPRPSALHSPPPSNNFLRLRSLQLLRAAAESGREGAEEGIPMSPPLSGADPRRAGGELLR